MELKFSECNEFRESDNHYIMDSGQVKDHLSYLRLLGSWSLVQELQIQTILFCHWVR